MKSIKPAVAFTVFALASTGLAGIGRSLAVWRGETADMLVFECDFPDETPPGITLRKGTLERVDYRSDPRELQYSSVADRAVWGGDGLGPGIVEVSVSPEVKAGVYQLGGLKLTVVD